MVERAAPHGLRLWPGLLAAGLLLPVRFLLPVVWPDGMVVAVIGSVLCGLLAVVWWTFFSRAPRADRWGGLGLHRGGADGDMGARRRVAVHGRDGHAGTAARTADRRPRPGRVGGASRGLADGPRRASMAATIAAACGVLLLVRTDGMTSTLMGSDFHWRWTPTAEEVLLASAPPLPSTAPIAASSVPATPAPVAAAASAPSAATAAVDANDRERHRAGSASQTKWRSSGRGFADGLATASCAASASRRIG